VSSEPTGPKTQCHIPQDQNPILLCGFVSSASEVFTMDQSAQYATAHAQCSRSNYCTLLMDRAVHKLLTVICSAAG
jgi:hypothetical protein